MGRRSRSRSRERSRRKKDRKRSRSRSRLKKLYFLLQVSFQLCISNEEPFKGLMIEIVSANVTERGLALVIKNRRNRETESEKSREIESLVDPARVKQKDENRAKNANRSSQI